jgi:multidrug efflux pump subunit AcrA (membrane-fusion protein)
VISLTPELIKNGNVFYVHGLVELDPTSFGKPFNLPIGLNASVDIIGGRSLNTLLVPVEALRPVGDGSYAVFVLENGTPKLRMVEVGLTDFTTAEILSGLKIGEEVTTGIVETVQ